MNNLVQMELKIMNFSFVSMKYVRRDETRKTRKRNDWRQKEILVLGKSRKLKSFPKNRVINISNIAIVFSKKLI